MHSEIIDATGGSHGVREIGLLMSIVERPKARFGGEELYEGIFQKAAVYLEALIQYHVFIDGNKRTGAISCARFLSLNGYELVATNKALEAFVVRVVVEKLELNSITDWLEKYSKKMK